MALDKIGYLKLRPRTASGALAAYEESLAITRRLADTDKNNAVWQRDIAVGLNKMGDVKFFAGDDAKGALAAYDESLAIARHLAKANTNNAHLQRDLSVVLDKIGDVKRTTRRSRRLEPKASPSPRVSPRSICRMCNGKPISSSASTRLLLLLKATARAPYSIRR